MFTSKMQVLFSLAVVATLCGTAAPVAATSCHAHSHAHDQCAWQTRSRTKSGWSSLSCDANSNTPGVHSHAFANANCFLFFCNKVVGGHGWFQNGCGSKHYWWHANAGTGRFVVVSDEPTAELEVLIPVKGAPETLPPPTGLKPAEGALVRQGMSAADDAVVNMRVKVGIGMPDGEFASLLEGKATLGGPKSRAPGLKASAALERLLGRQTRDEQGGRLTRAEVGKDYISRRVKVPTNKELEFVFDLHIDVGGDEPKEDEIRYGSPREGTGAVSAASLAATLRLVDQSGRFVLKSLDRKEADEREELGSESTRREPVAPGGGR